MLTANSPDYYIMRVSYLIKLRLSMYLAVPEHIGTVHN